MADGRRCVSIIPVSALVATCHLAPRFNYIPSGVTLNHRTDLLSVARRFFFNHYYNFFVFLLIRHWRRLARKRNLNYQ